MKKAKVAITTYRDNHIYNLQIVNLDDNHGIIDSSWSLNRNNSEY